MPYQSRLGAVLLMRTLKEEEAHREWARARKILDAQQACLNAFNTTLQTTLTGLAGLQNGGFVVAQDLTLYFRFIENVREGIKQQEQVVMREEAVCEGKRALLEEAVKARKVIETIEEKRKGAYWDALYKKEQAVLDEISGQLPVRSHG